MSTPSSIVGEQYSTGRLGEAEAALALLALVVGHLGGVLAGLQALAVGGDRLVEVDEELVRRAAAGRRRGARGSGRGPACRRPPPSASRRR